MRKLMLIATVVMAALPALADDKKAHPIMDGIREACAADVKQFCANVEPGGGRIVRCMRENEEKLSQPCKDARAAARAKIERPSK